METTEQYLQKHLVLDQDGTARTAFYNLAVYKNIQAARIAIEYYQKSAAFIDANGNEVMMYNINRRHIIFSKFLLKINYTKITSCGN